MDIVIKNCSSPGAIFSDNTNSAILKIYRWIEKNVEQELKFIDFRKMVVRDTKINDNNARNIFPLLKNCGFLKYGDGVIVTKKLFTDNGLIYINLLETKERIINADYPENVKKEALSVINNNIEIMIRIGLKRILTQSNANYVDGLKWFIEFLLEFDKINKNEFALMVSIMSSYQKDDWKNIIQKNIKEYRNGNTDINVKVLVRNDGNDSNVKSTKEAEISYFTCYTYYSGILLEAGLTTKISGYNVVKNRGALKDLLEANV